MISYLTCRWCASKHRPGIGTVYVANTGLETYYCSRRCRIHSINKRNIRC